MGDSDDWGGGSIPLMSILLIVALIALLFTARYPQGVYDFVMGINRWLIDAGYPIPRMSSLGGRGGRGNTKRAGSGAERPRLKHKRATRNNRGFRRRGSSRKQKTAVVDW